MSASNRPKRNVGPPKPVYVPDEDVVMEDDSDSGVSDLSDIETGDEVSVSGDSDEDSGENEYQYDDFLVPDDHDSEEDSECAESESESSYLTDSSEDEYSSGSEDEDNPAEVTGETASSSCGGEETSSGDDGSAEAMDVDSGAEQPRAKKPKLA